MPVIEYYIKGLQNYVNFSGRASRPEFWWYTLGAFIIGVIASIIDQVMGFQGPEDSIGTIGLIVALAHLLPGFAIGIRRFHDQGKSGWMILICLIPFLGFLIYLFMMAQPGDDFDNEYGPVA
jgi:uncharacterized membrane protein YhaH (DUF805 family)